MLGGFGACAFVMLPCVLDRRAVTPILAVPAVPIEKNEVRTSRSWALGAHFVHAIQPLDRGSRAAFLNRI